MNFKAWMAKADSLMNARLGISSLDLPDWDWYSAYDDGYSPNKAVSECLEDMANDGDIPMELIWTFRWS